MRIAVICFLAFSLVSVQASGRSERLFEVGPSKIHGEGLIALRRIEEGTKIVAGWEFFPSPGVTEDGSWVNHCGIRPSTKLTFEPKSFGEWWIVSLRDIEPGEEITCDYDAPGLENMVKSSGEGYVEC